MFLRTSSSLWLAKRRNKSGGRGRGTLSTWPRFSAGWRVSLIAPPGRRLVCRCGLISVDFDVAVLPPQAMEMLSENRTFKKDDELQSELWHFLAALWAIS